jgi:hypothetical protein
MLDNYYSRAALGGAVNLGRTLVQAHGSIGGHKNVFVKITKSGKSELTYPTTGGIMTNPFKGRAKMYAGDLVEYTPNQSATEGATVKVLKYYEVAKAATATDTEIYLIRDGYHHIPFVGDNIMVGAKSFATKGTGVTVTAVVKTTDSNKDVYKLTLSATLGAALKVGDILVEAASAGSSVLPMVTNPNAILDTDMDFLYDPTTDDDDFDGAKYFFTPCLANADAVLNLKAVGTLPPAVLAANKCSTTGWFYLNF